MANEDALLYWPQSLIDVADYCKRNVTGRQWEGHVNIETVIDGVREQPRGQSTRRQANIPRHIMPDNNLFQTLTYTFMIHEHPTKSTPSELNTNSPKKCLKYNLPHIINATPAIVEERIDTHSLRVVTTLWHTIPDTKIYRYMCNAKLLYL